ncbi:MAG: putative DNA-binding domain-containing protein [Alphaproteobacteria bacterium]|nr:putative DNA-binding domain-containing protein [Alphaproteobacteria bacterium]MDE2112761.1 putative DNA-binding domain-containing protein [Alphaproteobacteria bacterium]MDE2495704.1 putative DNA-binding domain-containing protein [Alphaproteobacteria bacterium]
MLPLHEFQAAMASYLSSPPGPDVSHHLKSMMRPSLRSVERRLAVYKNNVYARLVDALRDSFPAVERLVGEDFFRYAAVQYVSITPPKSPTLLGYGKDFARFLENFRPRRIFPIFPMSPISSSVTSKPITRQTRFPSASSGASETATACCCIRLPVF